MKEIQRLSWQEYTAVAVLSQLILLMSSSRTLGAESAEKISLLGCQDSCGGVPIPYPFGIGENCSMEGFELSCESTRNGTSNPYLGDFRVLNISISLGQARINMPVSSECYNSTTKKQDITDWRMILDIRHSRFNHEKNKIVVIGCDTLAYVNFTYLEKSYLGGCVSWCDSPESLTNESCSGIGCCQTSIPKGTNEIVFQFDNIYNNPEVYSFSRCGYAMVTEADAFMFQTSYITTKQLLSHDMPAVIDWVITNASCNTASTNSSSFACTSSNSICVNSTKGYHGNPYLEDGCQGLSLALSQFLLINS